jgi:phage-related protein
MNLGVQVLKIWYPIHETIGDSVKTITETIGDSVKTITETIGDSVKTITQSSDRWQW